MWKKGGQKREGGFVEDVQYAWSNGVKKHLYQIKYVCMTYHVSMIGELPNPSKNNNNNKKNNSSVFRNMSMARGGRKHTAHKPSPHSAWPVQKILPQTIILMNSAFASGGSGSGVCAWFAILCVWCRAACSGCVSSGPQRGSEHWVLSGKHTACWNAKGL